MNGSSFLHRLTRILVVGAIVAGTTASVAAAGVNRPPDVSDAAATLYSTPQGIKADGLRLQGIAQVYKQIGVASTPDAFERYATAHPYGSGLSSATTSTLVSRPPDVRDAAASLYSTPQGVKADGLRLQGIAQVYKQIGVGSVPTLVSRPPDVRDAAEAARFVSVGQPSSGFDWNDWAIGIGSGIGIALL
ncbi:MAG TPA: hypothetical protein VJT84_02425, partial [Gaiellaceae bacterium]|nr:hypothetical protein [Gaiellaceae bacterium]